MTNFNVKLKNCAIVHWYILWLNFCLYVYLVFPDTDPCLLEKQELQQPTYVALSYINR